MQFIRNIWTNHKGKTIFGILFIVIIILIISGGRGNNGDEKSDYTVDIANIEESISVSGNVEPVASVDLAFEVSGRVSSVLADVGDRVFRGETLVRLDTSVLSAELEEARANVDLKKAQIENAGQSAQIDLQNTIDKQNTLVLNALRDLYNVGLEAELVSGVSSVTPTISGTYVGDISGSYSIEVFNTGAGLQINYSGLESGTAGISSSGDVALGNDGLFLDFSNVQPGSRWQIDIPNTKSSSYITKLNAYNSALETRDTEIAKAEGGVSENDAAIRQAEAQVQSILAQIAARRITAPFSGIITDRDVERGEIVAANDILMSLISDDNFEIHAQIPEIDIARVSLDDVGMIKLDAYPEEDFSATVISIDPAESIVDGVPVYEITLSFDVSDDRIRSGMTATIDITTGMIQEVLAVPQEYIYSDLGGQYVIARNGEELEKTYISTGLRGTNGLIEVLDGLQMGQVLSPDDIEN